MGFGDLVMAEPCADAERHWGSLGCCGLIVRIIATRCVAGAAIEAISVQRGDTKGQSLDAEPPDAPDDACKRFLLGFTQPIGRRGRLT